MKIKFLGTGNCAKIPVYGCQCKACHRAHNLNGYSRQPSCLLIEVNEKQYMIDAGMSDFEKHIHNLNGIFVSHFHMDHVSALFHLRWGVVNDINVYCPNDDIGCADLYKNNGILNFNKIESTFETFTVDDLSITTVPLNHSKLTVGYCIEHAGKKIAYLCDTKGLPETSMQFLKQWKPDALIIDCTYPPKFERAYNHNDLDEALSIIKILNNPKTYLTHIGHELDCYLMEHELPAGVHLAMDFLEITIDYFDLKVNN